MAFSIVIPSRNATNLVPCVKAIRDAGETARVIVVDDGVDWNAAASMIPGLHLFKRELGVKPFVFSRNINIGIRSAGTDDVILLNDDALLKTPMGFTALAKVAEENPEYGVIGAVTNLTGQPLQMPRTGPGSGLRSVGHIAYVCVYVPRRTVDNPAIGLLDERYCLDYGCDDRDQCEAVNRAGLKVGVFDGCYVDHGSLTSTFRGDPKAPRSFAKNYQLLMEKWGTLTP